MKANRFGRFIAAFIAFGVLSMFMNRHARANEVDLFAKAANADTIATCMRDGKDGPAQQTCVLGAVMLAMAQQRSVPAGFVPSAPPAPVIVNSEPTTFGGWLGKMFFTGVKEGWETAKQVAPHVAQYRMTKVNSDASVKQAEYQSLVLRDAFGANVRIAESGFNAATRTAQAGFARPIQAHGPSYVYNLTGSNAHFGTGDFRWTNCYTGSTSPGGSATGTTGQVNGGSSAPSGSNSC